MEIDGFEPTTLCLQSRCSSQLSYTPFFSFLFGDCFVRLHIVGRSLPLGNSLPPHSPSSHPSKNKLQKPNSFFLATASLPLKKLLKNLWEQRESNPRPSACKADALNQLSYAPERDCKGRQKFFTCKLFMQNLSVFSRLLNLFMKAGTSVMNAPSV